MEHLNGIDGRIAVMTAHYGPVWSNIGLLNIVAKCQVVAEGWLTRPEA